MLLSLFYKKGTADLKHILTYVLSVALILGMISAFPFNQKAIEKAKAEVNIGAFDSNNLISNSEFVNVEALSSFGIQSFLSAKGSVLASFSEGGRSAAQIIYDASHGYGDASGTINGIVINTSTGTINPYALLATLQKEQSLVTRATADTNTLNKAMGYGCPDSGGCYPEYSGFTKQVEWGAWQLRYNYERAAGHGFGDYQAGQTQTFDDWNGSHTVTYFNQATAALYRYTPHVYNGNYNFWLFYHQYVSSYQYEIASQSSNAWLWQGDSQQFVLRLRNTGSMSWTQEVVHLGTDRGRDRVPAFLREGDGPSGWISSNRIIMQEATVAPGEIGTFIFWMRAPGGMNPGVYREYFRPVAEGIGWLEDTGIYWTITVRAIGDGYDGQLISQNSYPTLESGASYQFVVRYINTGYHSWYRGLVNLGTSRPNDRASSFIREGDGPSGWISPNRVAMQEWRVDPGQVATFVFWMKVPSGMSGGDYREYFRLVAEGIRWFSNDGTYWNIHVNSAAVAPAPAAPPSYQYEVANQNAYPTINRGSAYQFVLSLRNTGSQSWYQHVVHLGTDRGLDRISALIREGDGPSGWVSPNRIMMQEYRVDPGQTATFVFWMTAGAGMTPGIYREYFRPVADGVAWMEDRGIFWYVGVR